MHEYIALEQPCNVQDFLIYFLCDFGSPSIVAVTARCQSMLHLRAHQHWLSVRQSHTVDNERCASPVTNEINTTWFQTLQQYFFPYSYCRWTDISSFTIANLYYKRGLFSRPNDFTTTTCSGCCRAGDRTIINCRNAGCFNGNLFNFWIRLTI